MATLTPEEITNLYLYGSKTTPSNLLDEKLIRAPNVTSTTSVDINDYMSEIGRFASPAFFEIIQEFFSASGLAAGSYTEQSLRQVLGVSEAYIVQKQWAFDDGTDDYASRVYIWNSVAFEIDDRATFIVGKDGSRRIENFAIIPLNGGPENFDFSSGDIFATMGNGYLESIVDPSGIGRKVNISFTGSRTLITLDQQDYLQAVATKPDENLLPRASALSDIQELTDDLFSAGPTRALFHNKPIFYGSQQSDSMEGYAAKNEDLDDHRQLDDYAGNGIAYVGGAGNDTIVGTN